MIPDEKAVLVDKDDNVLEYRQRIHIDNMDRHRIVSVWLTTPEGLVLIAKRSDTMKIQPDRWGPAAAGTVTHTESYETTAYRELKEEIGVDNIPLKRLGKFRVAEDRGERRICEVYTGTLDSPLSFLKLQKEEVAEVKLISLEELRKAMTAHPNQYVVNMDLLLDMVRGKPNPAFFN